MRSRSARSGITLLEVLFSMFILAIGILSIASLIPAAKHLVRDSVHSDRATALGLSALAEAQNRDFLDYCRAEPYTDANANGIWDSGEAFTDTNANAVWDEWPYGVILDPLALAAPANADGTNPDIAALASFPYTTPIGGTAAFGGSPFQRTTPWPFAFGAAGLLAHDGIARRIFAGQDDLAFTTPADTALRPGRSYTAGVDGGWGFAGGDDDGDGATDEPDEAGAPLSDDIAQTDGQYSYILSVMPGAPDQYVVSAAVFYRRDVLLPLAGSESADPAERILYADLIGSGLSGGDFRMRGADDTPADQLKVRPNEWIALIGWRSGSAATTSVSIPGGVTGQNVPFLLWYRVLGASDVDPLYDLNGTPCVGRDMTLSGPDLIYRLADGTILAGSGVDDDDDAATDPVPYDADADLTNGLTFQVAVFKDCIGVYERVIRND